MGAHPRVREYQPVVHRLRLSASPEVPTPPGRTGLAQEPLVFRRARFSLALSLLMPAFSLPSPPPLNHFTASLETGRSPTQPPGGGCRRFGGVAEARYN